MAEEKQKNAEEDEQKTAMEDEQKTAMEDEQKTADGQTLIMEDSKKNISKDKQIVIDEIERKRQEICDLADSIWEYAELSLQEFRSAALYCTFLKQEGFEVREGICGIDTAFAAVYGSGRPVIGILAEYDALSGLSQKAGEVRHDPVVSGGSGHGCGHNILGAGAFAAALGVKAFLKETGTPGTVILFGCPGEEGGAAKAFMARDGVWRHLDAALTWHPEDVNEVCTGSTNSCIQVQYKFYGVPAHAAAAPERGRSALDAVELMNIGVQFLREHMSDKARIHYAITDTGGVSPNVVQAQAGVLYMIRSNHVDEAVALTDRVDKIAEGAALMTDTTYERKFIDGLADTIKNGVLEKVLYENFELTGVPAYTDEENAFADALSETYEGNDAIPGIAAENDEAARARVEKQRAACGHAMNDFLAPLYEGECFRAGSTDVGDVSYQTPTAQIHVASWPNGCPGHSWQNVSCDRTEIGHKAAVCAGEVLACAAVDLYTDPAILTAARAEFERRTAGGYTCPIPPEAVPCVPDLG